MSRRSVSSKSNDNIRLSEEDCEDLRMGILENVNNHAQATKYCDLNHPRKQFTISIYVDLTDDPDLLVYTFTNAEVADILYEMGVHTAKKKSGPFTSSIHKMYNEAAKHHTHSRGFSFKDSFITEVKSYYGNEWVELYYNAGIAGVPRPSYVSAEKLLSRRRSSRSISPTDNIIDTCMFQFQGINNARFKKNANRLIRLCNQLTRDCTVNRVKLIRDHIHSYYKQGTKVALPEIPRLDPAHPFKDLANFVLITNAYDPSTSLTILNNLFEYSYYDVRIRYQGQDGVGMGLTNNFLTSAVKEIVGAGLFKPVALGSPRHVVNPKMTPALMRRKGYEIHSEQDLDMLYLLVGKLFAFCLRFDVPIPIQFAHALLGAMVYPTKDITSEMWVMYMFMDQDPEITSNQIKLMREPETIEFVDINMNEEYELKPGQGEVIVTDKTYLEYLSLYAQHKYLRKLTSDGGSKDITRYTHAFLNGFYIKNMLHDKKTTARELDKLISGWAINLQSIKEWLDSGNIAPLDIDETTKDIYKWFMLILHDLGNSFPVDSPLADKFKVEVENDDREQRGDKKRERSINFNSTSNKKKLFLKFFVKLMHFWIGFEKIDPNGKYQVIFNNEDGMLLAQTCFKQLSLPKNVKSQEELYERMMFSVLNVEKGVGRI